VKNIKKHKKFIILASVVVLLIATVLIFVFLPKGTIIFPNFTSIDFTLSPYKHINNGGITTSDKLPYNVDAIAGATVTVEGPAVVSSIPLSMREIENRNDGLFRGVYTDSNGSRIYEGLDLYYLLTGMTKGDNGIILTDTAYKVLLKNSNRVTIASITIADIIAAHERGRPYLLAYGVGTLDEKYIAPFVFDAANPKERSEGYIVKLDNSDGCLKFVYDMDASESKKHKFTNVAYVYICEENEPGFTHTGLYGSSRYTDYIITFRGEALGCEMNFTVKQLEELAQYDGDIGYSDLYSLANNAYWYVNEYEGLDLYKLLLYLGMDEAQTMGLSKSRTTLVRFIADDGFLSPESFSVDTLSYPDTFGFYNKNAVDAGDGSYIPTNADLVQTGYPVLLAYGVNNYPYTITKQDPGYLSGLSNDGGPMRIVFGKTQYNHPNGSNQVKFLRDVIVGQDVLYNTHKYTEVQAHRALANNTLTVTVNGEDGGLIQQNIMTVGDIEDIIYGENITGNIKKAARVKDHYQNAVYEGVNLEYFLMEVLGLPGTNGTVIFNDTVTVNLNSLVGKDIIAFAKNGSPMVVNSNDPGYIKNIALNPTLESEPAYYTVENNGGPLAVFIDNGDISIFNVTSITVDLIPDAYAHLDHYANNTIHFYGEGLERNMTFTVGEIQSRQRLIKTLDYGQQRFRGIPVYDLFIEIGIKSNAGDVIFYDSEGNSYQYPLSKLKSRTNIALLAYGKGVVGEDVMIGFPLVNDDGGPLVLVIESEIVKDIIAVEVTANEIDSWGHSMSDIYSEFLDFEFTFTVRNDDSEWTQVFTVGELEEMTDLIVREKYSVLDIGECEGIDIWKFIKRYAGNVPGIDDPIAITVYAVDGYKNDLLSVFYKEGFELGIADGDGNRKPLIIAYAVNGLPFVDSESHEGYTGLAGNGTGPLRVIAETNQGASVKYVNKLVVTVPGSGNLE